MSSLLFSAAFSPLRLLLLLLLLLLLNSHRRNHRHNSTHTTSPGRAQPFNNARSLSRSLARSLALPLLAKGNRPNDIDPAFQRRLARKIYVGLPEAAQRLAILRITMAKDMDRLQDYRPPATAVAAAGGGGGGGGGGGDGEQKQPLPPPPPFFADLARDLEYYSGHDIKELCRVAIMTPIRE